MHGLTNLKISIEQSLWEADMSSANQEISRILWNLNAYYSIPKADQSNPCLPLPPSPPFQLLECTV